MECRAPITWRKGTAWTQQTLDPQANLPSIGRT
jgi:hypothetical protein